MSKEEDYNKATQENKLLIDHDYDGIKELDNPPPSWLMIIFYGTIIWSVFYVFYYHVYGGPSQEEEYLTEMIAAEADAPKSTFDETNFEILTDTKSMEEGQELYTASCVACHGASNIGADLTDEYWIHGNTPSEVFKSIKYGILEKGMLAFNGQMTDKQIQILTSYILTEMKGAENKNTKGPEGKKY